MARQVIDTTTNNGSYIGDPAKTAFEKTNANFAEIYGWGGSGALAKLVGGNSFSGDQSIAGNLSLQGDFVVRKGVPILTMVSAAADRGYRWLSNIGNGVDFGCTFENFNGSGWSPFITYAGGTSGNTSFAGTVSAPAFNPTSSADVKDYIEGYSGDACAELDRLAVCTYRYRPEFFDSGKVYVGIIAENLAAVRPDAVTEETHTEVVTVPIGEDGEGNTITEERERIVPMGYDMAQLLALSVRSHQQKNRRIRMLEDALAAVHQRLNALESFA